MVNPNLNNQPNYQTSNRKPILIVVAVILGLVILITAITLIVTNARNNHIINDGVKTTGVATGQLFQKRQGGGRTGHSTDYNVEYGFMADGKTYTAKGTTTYNIEKDAESAASHRTEITIYYLADDPTQNYAKDTYGNR